MNNHFTSSTWLFVERSACFQSKIFAMINHIFGRLGYANNSRYMERFAKEIKFTSKQNYKQINLWLNTSKFNFRKRNYINLVLIFFFRTIRNVLFQKAISDIEIHSLYLITSFRLPWLDQSLLRWRLHYIIHLNSRIAELLSTRTVRATCCTFFPCHHKKRYKRYDGNQEETAHDRAYDYHYVESLVT